MSRIVDARGLSCPQPVLMTLEEIKNLTKGEIEILVDTDTSKENVSRAAKSRKWQVEEIHQEDEGYRIKIKKDED
jgi:tRNA 2-thiouridine synthesizing protein A